MFRGDYRDKAVWLLVRQLEQRDLVVVRRNYEGGVEEFIFRPEAEGILKEPAPASASNTLTTHLNVRLQKNAAKSAVQQPDFSGAFSPQTLVQLAAGSRFGYAAWLTKKGDLLLQVAPFESVQRYQKTDSGSPEPVSIQQVIERLFSSPDEDAFG